MVKLFQSKISQALLDFFYILLKHDFSHIGTFTHSYYDEDCRSVYWPAIIKHRYRAWWAIGTWTDSIPNILMQIRIMLTECRIITANGTEYTLNLLFSWFSLMVEFRPCLGVISIKPNGKSVLSCRGPSTIISLLSRLHCEVVNRTWTLEYKVSNCKIWTLIHISFLIQHRPVYFVGLNP